MRKLLIRTAVAGGAASLTLLGLSGSTIAAHASAPEGCIAAGQGSSVTNGGYVVIGSVQGNGATPSSAPSPSAQCAYEATVAASGYSAAGTYTITYGVGTLNSAGTACTYGTNPTTTITGSAAAPTAITGGPNVAGDCVQVTAG
ncbi:MAG: hypothetical protein JWO37_2899 [Acidimicrobiales bacterium]|nr:hypothetical protein [Acidimicrobiales bacterium]